MENEALVRLEPLIGSWDLTLSNAWFLDSLEERHRGWATFERLDDIYVLFRRGPGEDLAKGLRPAVRTDLVTIVGTGRRCQARVRSVR